MHFYGSLPGYNSEIFCLFFSIHNRQLKKLFDVTQVSNPCCVRKFYFAGDYLETKYLNRHQGNCYYVNPGDCLHLNDGVYPHPHSKNLTLFIRCYRNRLVEEGNCPIDRELGTQTYPYKGNCILTDLQYRPLRRLMDSSQAVLRCKMGTTSSERGRVMHTIDAKAGEPQR